jgi:phosphotransferase system HPr-like phosphotransfer protein
VTVASTGQVDVSATQTGTSLPNGTAPLASEVTRTADGFTFTIVVEPGISYTVTSDAGTVVLNGSTVTVSGLGAGATTSVHITATTPDALDATTTVSGSALLAGIAPTLSSPVPAARGFVFTITNYSPAFSYELSTSAGAVSRNGNEVTVTGLAPRAGALVQLVATRSGYQPAGASVIGQSSAPAPAPAPETSSTPTLTPITPNVVPATTPALTPPGGASRQDGASAMAHLQDSKAGTAAVTSGGTTLPSTLSTSGNTVKVDAHNGLTLTVAAQKDGSTLPLGAGGVVEVGPGEQLWVTVTGFGQQSGVTFWTVGDEAQLAAARTDATGAAATSIVVPASLAAGGHTLVVTGVDAQGKTVTMQVAIRVTGTHPASAGSSAGDTWWIWSLAALLLLLGGWWWFVIARRRRREDEQAA